MIAIAAAASLGPVLTPAGADARFDAPLAWALIGGGALLFGGVMLLLAVAVVGRRQAPRRLRAWRWIVGGGLVLPIVVLTALHAANLHHMARLDRAAPAGALQVGVSARLWWWELRLHDPQGGAEIVLANELHLPLDQPVRLGLSSEEVIHSFWVPALAGKVDMIPGRVQQLVLEAKEPGVWRGPCAEFCGEPHSRMVLHVVGETPAQFDVWLAGQRQPARAPQTAQEQRGLQHFTELSCAACHVIRGVTGAAVLGRAGGVVGVASGHGGPDLTHLASRRYLAASDLRNDAAGLRAWLSDVQRHKAGARMPSYGHLDAATLDALVAYLGSLQ